MLVFFISFILYLYTMFPAVAQYRDTGEMVTLGYTLGIAHPPGYPFYALLSKAFMLIMPYATMAYRLNVLSALSGALAAWLIYRFLLRITQNNIGSAVFALLFSVSYLQWYLAIVNEMYALNIVFALILLYLAYLLCESTVPPLKLCALFGFVFGLGVTNRMDLLLLSAGLSLVFLLKIKRIGLKGITYIALFFVLGLSLYLYLPIRSAQNPILDWNHPATMSKLWSTLTRKTHGGTLDLISSSYASGKNFMPGIKFYFNHLADSFTYPGLLFILAGIYALWRAKRNYALSCLAAWTLSGPVFIYLSNMPPNTHAYAILEAHFLLPNTVAWIFAIFGFKMFTERFKGKLALLIPLGMVCYSFSVHAPQLNKRENFIAYDYSKNILRSAPKDSIVVLKEDVQLFSMWNRQIVEKQRLDTAIIAQGLSASFWYGTTFRVLYPGFNIMPVKTPAEWLYYYYSINSKGLYFSQDADFVPFEQLKVVPNGLINRLTDKDEKNIKAGVLLSEIYPYRGKYNYDAYREFFTPDLIEDYSKGYLQLGLFYLGNNNIAKARECFQNTLRFKPLFPVAAANLAYTFYVEGNYASAAAEYAFAAKLYAKYIKMALDYNTLESYMVNIRKEASDNLVALGVCYEKINSNEKSIRAYNDALKLDISNKEAYFNRSVVYWKLAKWDLVVRDLQSALRIDPNYADAKYYLEKLQRQGIGKR